MEEISAPRTSAVDGVSALPPSQLTLMSLNVQGQAAFYGGGRIDVVADLVEQWQPDVVALQEVHRETWRSRFLDQLEQLRERTGMEAVFGASVTIGKGAWGNALLTRGEVLHSLTHSLPGGAEPRTMLECLIGLRGGTFTAYVTHLTSWGRWRRSSRLRQAARVARIARRSRLPFVLAGGFDSPPTSRELRLFSDERSILSCLGPGENLDYLFVHPRWAVESAGVLSERASDHAPLMAKLAWRGSGG